MNTSYFIHSRLFFRFYFSIPIFNDIEMHFLEFDLKVLTAYKSLDAFIVREISSTNGSKCIEGNCSKLHYTFVLVYIYFYEK